MVLTLKNFLPQSLSNPPQTPHCRIHLLQLAPRLARCPGRRENGSECVSVGEDERVNLVSVGNLNWSHRRFLDSNGLVSYTTAKWASPMEFATGGLGFSLQW
ncbi:unnamed protein product [Camellia sinensis]